VFTEIIDVDQGLMAHAERKCSTAPARLVVPFGASRVTCEAGRPRRQMIRGHPAGRPPHRSMGAF